MAKKTISLTKFKTYPATDVGINILDKPDIAPPFWGWGSYFNFGKSEMETEAQFILNFSLAKKQWVGVSCKDFVFILRDSGFRSSFYKLFPKWTGYKTYLPAIPENDSGVRIFCCGTEGSRFNGFPASVVTGIQMLRKDGWLNVINVNGEDVIFPTPELITNLINRINEGILELRGVR
jgi:hypothetical protein